MADRQQFIIEGIAKVDNVLDGIKKIQTGLGNLKMPDTTQKQFENLYKRADDYADKAKKALSSGFETKGAVKDYTTALKGISDIYSEILEKMPGDAVCLYWGSETPILGRSNPHAGENADLRRGEAHVYLALAAGMLARLPALHLHAFYGFL